MISENDGLEAVLHDKPVVKLEAKAVPALDLQQGPPGFQEPEVQEWLSAELAAFKDTRVWSEESEVHVTEVAVSSGNVRYENWADSRDYTYHHAPILTEAVGLRDSCSRPRATSMRV
jgi:hypothetical protein